MVPSIAVRSKPSHPLRTVASLEAESPDEASTILEEGVAVAPVLRIVDEYDPMGIDTASDEAEIAVAVRVAGIAAVAETILLRVTRVVSMLEILFTYAGKLGIFWSPAIGFDMFRQ